MKCFLILTSIIILILSNASKKSSKTPAQQTQKCPAPEGVPMSFAEFNGKKWFEYKELSIPTGQSCMTNIYKTRSGSNAKTSITRSYINSKGKNRTQKGSLNYNQATGEFNVKFPGYPRAAKYYLTYFKISEVDGNGIAAFYMCNQKHKSIQINAWILISDLSVAQNQDLMNNAMDAISNTGVSSLQQVNVNDCS